MTRPYRVVQWATGVVGSAALRGILRHPRIELAGVTSTARRKRAAGSEVVSYEAKHDYILANQDIETAVGIVKKDTIALNHYRHIGRTREGTEIGFHLANAVPLVCEAPEPGIKTYLDLPMITGCMGTHAVAR